MKRIFTSSLVFLATQAAFGVGVDHVSADSNVRGQRIAVTGWEYVAQGDWQPVSVQIFKGKKVVGSFAGECTRPIDAAPDRETITCRGPNDFPLSGATYIGRWEEKRGRYTYVCTFACGPLAPKRIYVYTEEPEGDDENG